MSGSDVRKREPDFRSLISGFGIGHVGVCSFSALLPLFENRSKGRLPDNPRSVIVCALPYFSGEYPRRNVARYAVCDDYHNTGGALLGEISGRLAEAFPGYVFVPFIDVSPIPEVKAARLAGLGTIGLHGQLILPGWGAYVFIGCIVTDLLLEPSPVVSGPCPQCEACIKACPTNALTRNGLRRELCRSYITQKRGKLTPWEENEVRAGKMAWGCDICLDACPRNQTSAITDLECMRRSPLPVIGMDNLDEAITRKAYGFRGRKVLERNLQLTNNACHPEPFVCHPGPFSCHSERSEESLRAQGKLREGS